MKKYTIKDNLGNKKTVYAENLSHALTFVDSKVKDANRPTTLQALVNDEDSKIVDAVQSAETYANTGWIEDKLASDLINEGQKNDYDFDAVLKKFDSLSKQILAVVKNALDKARKEIVDYKSRY